MVIITSSRSDADNSSLFVTIPDDDNQVVGTDEVLRILGREVWKLYGTRIFLQKKMGVAGNNVPTVAELIPWKESESLPSSQGTALVSRVQAFHKAGHNRSILLYGRPGVGKSCMAKYIASELSATMLIVDQAQLGSESGFMLLGVLSMLRPEVVVVDDFDRLTEPENLLGFMDQMRCYVKLFIATVNNKDVLGDAIVRAGRFDEVIEVVAAHDDVSIRKGDFPDEIFEKVKDWPLAFVEELKRRIEILGIEAATSELPGLTLRVEANQRVKDSHKINGDHNEQQKN
jgi:hypothetical protein